MKKSFVPISAFIGMFLYSVLNIGCSPLQSIPEITRISPGKASIFDSVDILGIGIVQGRSTFSVSIGGESATILAKKTVSSDPNDPEAEYITVRVPNGTGYGEHNVSVTVDGKTSNTLSMTVRGLAEYEEIDASKTILGVTGSISNVAGIMFRIRNFDPAIWTAESCELMNGAAIDRAHCDISYTFEENGNTYIDVILYVEPYAPEYISAAAGEELIGVKITGDGTASFQLEYVLYIDPDGNEHSVNGFISNNTGGTVDFGEEITLSNGEQINDLKIAPYHEYHNGNVDKAVLVYWSGQNIYARRYDGQGFNPNYPVPVINNVGSGSEVKVQMTSSNSGGWGIVAVKDNLNRIRAQVIRDNGSTIITGAYKEYSAGTIDKFDIAAAGTLGMIVYEQNGGEDRYSYYDHDWGQFDSSWDNLDNSAQSSFAGVPQFTYASEGHALAHNGIAVAGDGQDHPGCGLRGYRFQKGVQQVSDQELTFFVGSSCPSLMKVKDMAIEMNTWGQGIVAFTKEEQLGILPYPNWSYQPYVFFFTGMKFQDRTIWSTQTWKNHIRGIAYLSEEEYLVINRDSAFENGSHTETHCQPKYLYATRYLAEEMSNSPQFRHYDADRKFDSTIGIIKEYWGNYPSNISACMVDADYWLLPKLSRQKNGVAVILYPRVIDQLGSSPHLSLHMLRLGGAQSSTIIRDNFNGISMNTLLYDVAMGKDSKNIVVAYSYQDTSGNWRLRARVMK